MPPPVTSKWEGRGGTRRHPSGCPWGHRDRGTHTPGRRSRHCPGCSTSPPSNAFENPPAPLASDGAPPAFLPSLQAPSFGLGHSHPTPTAAGDAPLSTPGRAKGMGPAALLRATPLWGRRVSPRQGSAPGGAWAQPSRAGPAAGRGVTRKANSGEGAPELCHQLPKARRRPSWALSRLPNPSLPAWPHHAPLSRGAAARQGRAPRPPVPAAGTGTPGRPSSTPESCRPTNAWPTPATESGLRLQAARAASERWRRRLSVYRSLPPPKRSLG